MKPSTETNATYLHICIHKCTHVQMHIGTNTNTQAEQLNKQRAILTTCFGEQLHMPVLIESSASDGVADGINVGGGGEGGGIGDCDVDWCGIQRGG